MPRRLTFALAALSAELALGLQGSASAQAQDLRGKNIVFSYQTVRVTLNVLKSGQILMQFSNNACVTGVAGNEAWLGRSHKFQERCKYKQNICGADGRSKCGPSIPMYGESTASYGDGVLALRIAKRLGNGPVVFTDHWTIKIEGASCSGENRFTAFKASGVNKIESCRLGDGLAT